MAGDGARLEAEFVAGSAGRLFCTRFLPPGEVTGAVVFVPAFAEEMNKSRHVVAGAARALACCGIVVELLDLYGCGDSEGSLDDASWDVWLDDTSARLEALGSRFGVASHLWGMRAGALVAAAVACKRPVAKRVLLLWQPVHRGRQTITEVLRMRIAESMFGSGGPRETVDELRAALQQGDTVEVAGYALGGAATLGLDSATLVDSAPVGARVLWMEVAKTSDAGLGVASAKVVAAWQAGGVAIEASTVEGTAFWRSSELATCAAIERATRAAAEVLAR